MKLLRRVLLLLLPLIALLALWALAADTPRVTAPRAIVMDCDTGEVFYAKNADSPQPAASMTKLMTSYLICEDIQAGKLTWDSYIPVSAHAASISRNKAYSGMEELVAGRNYTVRTLTNLSLISSCCGSSVALGEQAGGGTEEGCVERMNATAAALGMDASFADASGFEDEGNSVTPRAMALLAREIIRLDPTVLNVTSMKQFYFNDKIFKNSCSLIRAGAYEGMDGLKSGYTFGANWCYTGTALRNGHRIITVVMGCPNYNSSMTDTRTLLDFGFRYIDQVVTPRENALTAALAGASGSISAEDGLVPFTDGHVSFTVDAMEGALEGCTASWYLDGEPVPGGTGLPFTFAQGETLSGTLPLDGRSGAVRVSLRVEGPGGRARTFSRELTLAPDVTVMAFLSPGDQTLRADSASAAVAVTVLTTAAEARVPYAWYLDGEPLAGYGGTFTGALARVFTFPAHLFETGDHRLALTLNPDGLPGLGRLTAPVALRVPAPSLLARVTGLFTRSAA